MNQSYYDTDYIPTNRDKVMSPRRSQGWCEGCDQTAPAEGTKCPICHRRQGWPRRRIKK